MKRVSYHSIAHGDISREEHRVNMVQLGVSFSSTLSDGLPSNLCPSNQYVGKIQQALILALQDQWSNILVFPEVSIPLSAFQELMTLSCNLIKSRAVDAGGCLICLPLEHLSILQFEKLVDKLLAHDLFVSGDDALSKSNLCGDLFKQYSPSDRKNAFVNVAVLIVFNQSGPNANGYFFIQPKLFPFPGERTPRCGRFLNGAKTHILELGGIKIMTSICFDLIAQPPGEGPYLRNLIHKVEQDYGNIDYLLIPQCNKAPLDNNFQRAVVDLYHPQIERQKMRVLSPNVASIEKQNSQFSAGNSWFATCPFGSELPCIGIWEKNLVSVLKDPSTHDIVRDAPSLGHYAQRLRLTAPGEWLVHLSLPSADILSRSRGPDVPLKPHSGIIYGWCNGEWAAKENEIFERDCRHAERLPGLKVMTEIGEWVQENIGGKNTYSPSYSEFIQNKVHLPRDDRTDVLSMLGRQNDVWLKGEPASGKTVFGIGVAFSWISEKKGRCLVFDLRDLVLDEVQFVEKAKGDIDWFFNSVISPLLVVLDNVHTHASTAIKLLRHIQKKRESGQKVQALLLGRNPQKRLTERNTLADNESLLSLELKATEEAFMCVAKRLTQKSDIAEKNYSMLASNWLSQCGGDLVVFASAFNPLKPDELDEMSIAEMVRQRYIVPSETQGGRNALFDICVLSSLDLNSEDTGIWQKSMESLFPLFVEDGTVLRVSLNKQNPRIYYRLFHPSLGLLILRVENNFSESQTKKLFISRALDLCYRKPFLLSLIHFRLASGNYSNVMNFYQWLNALNNETGLVEIAVCHSPFPTMLSLRSGDLNFSWDRLLKIPYADGYSVLLEKLALNPAHFTVQFLKFLDDQTLYSAKQDFLGALLNDEVFKERLARNPVHIVAQFLKYLDDQQLKKESHHLLIALLDKKNLRIQLAQSPVGDVVTFFKYLDDRKLKTIRQNLLNSLLKVRKFQECLTRTPAQFLVHFLKYLDSQELERERELILKNLLEDENFKERLSQTPAGDIVTLLRYLDNPGVSSDGQDLLKSLLCDEDFASNLFNSPPEAIACFLKYLDKSDNKHLAQIMLDNNWNRLEQTEFESILTPWSPSQLKGMQRAIREAGLTLVPELWTMLIKRIYGKAYRPVVPDKEYTQEILLRKSCEELTQLLTYFANIRQRYRLNCIVTSLKSDLEKFQAWIKLLSPKEAVLFRETVEESNISFSSETWKLITSIGDRECA